MRRLNLNADHAVFWACLIMGGPVVLTLGIIWLVENASVLPKQRAEGVGTKTEYVEPDH